MSRAKMIAATVGALAAGAVLATGITGIAAAANGTPSPKSSSPSAPLGSARAAQHGPDGHGGPGDHRDGHRGGMLGGPGGQALHGEVVVKATDGTISTVRMIDGTVTAVGADSITVKSADDFTATFTVNATTDIHVGLPTPGHRTDAQLSTPTAPAASTISDVQVGDVARVEGTVSGSSAAATEIHAMTAAQAAQMDQLRQQHDAQRGTRPPATGATPSSSASAA